MTLTLDIDLIAERLGAEPDAETRAAYRPRYNLPPTDPHVVVTRAEGKRRLGTMRWGMTREKPQFNARAETVHKIGLFKRSFFERRCLVPADGFYEWTGSKQSRRPIWFHPQRGDLLVFAGIYDERGFAVITTAAGPDVVAVHDRMPAILDADQAEKWLMDADTRLLRPADAGVLVGTPVSSRVNSVANDDPGCLGAPEGDPQLRLV